jgi:hypothetical protein
MDVAFFGQTTYVLVTHVGPDVGGSGIVGIYRMDGPDSFTVIADGHHNRVLHVILDGEVTEFATFGNIVPTGLAVSGNTVYI